MINRKVTVILLPNDLGGYQVFIPHFPNCTTEGDTVEEALKNAAEALEAILEEPDDLDIDALQYSYSPVVVVGEVQVKVLLLAKAKSTS